MPEGRRTLKLRSINFLTRVRVASLETTLSMVRFVIALCLEDGFHALGKYIASLCLNGKMCLGGLGVQCIRGREAVDQRLN
jgi:hypothetical protein